MSGYVDHGWRHRRRKHGGTDPTYDDDDGAFDKGYPYNGLYASVPLGAAVDLVDAAIVAGGAVAVIAGGGTPTAPVQVNPYAFIAGAAKYEVIDAASLSALENFFGWPTWLDATSPFLPVIWPAGAFDHGVIGHGHVSHGYNTASVPFDVMVTGQTHLEFLTMTAGAVVSPLTGSGVPWEYADGDVISYHWHTFVEDWLLP